MLSTVNVVEINDTIAGQVNQLVSFPDTPEGNKAAEALFTRLVRENLDDEEAFSTEDMEDAIEDGSYQSGTYRVQLVHSTGENGGEG